MQNKNTRRLKNKKTLTGFTLIELLVVIAVIGLLASIVLVALDNARNKARYSKILADSEQLLKAGELYYSSNGSYPTSTAQLNTIVPSLPNPPCSNWFYSFASNTTSPTSETAVYVVKPSGVNKVLFIYCGNQGGTACSWAGSPIYGNLSSYASAQITCNE